jgi:DNA-binding CsgD family transcriptional regulator
MGTTNNVAGQVRTLSKREQEVAAGLCAGLAPRQLAVQLGISLETTRKHRASLYRKLRVSNIVELMRALAPEQHPFLSRAAYPESAGA